MESPSETVRDGINPDEFLLLLAYRRCTERRQSVIRTFIHRLAYNEGRNAEHVVDGGDALTAVVIPIRPDL